MREGAKLRAGKLLLAAVGMSVTLAGCSAETAKTTGVSTAAAPPGGVVHTGAQANDMAFQYDHPRQGAVAAAGASAWVKPSPPPAFTVASLPPADPPAPPLAAVANRQPTSSSARSQVDASQIVRPEAAPADAPAATLSEATRQGGRALFASYSCGACHALADSGSAGGIGPSLDNPTLTESFVINILNNGRGAMPSFAGQMTDEEIGMLAGYIVGSRR
ncbi:MAG TPA: cytochrome c [Croceibacterium sp.]|nr:cytochrome c [Croceibacterium sp.]